MRLPTLSIVIPTLGRPSLAPLLDDLMHQIGPEDQILVIGDGPQPEARRMTKPWTPDIRLEYLEYGPEHCWGHPQRNYVLSFLSGTHLWSLNDDDGIDPAAIHNIRAGAANFPGRPLVFRIHHLNGLIWRDRCVEIGNVSTQCLVTPRSLFGSWGSHHQGDFDFLKSSSRRHPDGESSIVWRQEVIATHGISPDAKPIA